MRLSTATVPFLAILTRLWILALGFTVLTNAPCLAQNEPVMTQSSTLPPHALWLESLDLNLMTSGWGRPQAARSCEGNPLRLKGGTYPHGVGTHAVSKFTIDLKGSATRFISMVGVDDEMSGRGSVVFRVTVDGDERFVSRPLRGGADPQLVSVDLTGAKRLTLTVDNAGDSNTCGHSDWAGALLLLDARVTEQPVALIPGSDEPTEIKLPMVKPGRYNLFATLPRGGDYATVQFSIDGRPLGDPVDLFWYQPIKAVRVKLGTVETKAEGSVLRAEIVGRNHDSWGFKVTIEDVELSPPPAGIPNRLAWVKHVGACDPGGMVALPDGGALMTGAFWGTTVFGKGEPGATKLTAYGQRDIFVARYRADGTLAWVKQAGGREDDIGNAVAAMPDGGAVVTGKVVRRAIFGAGEKGQTISWGTYDAFVARFGPDGRLLWSKRIGDHNWAQGQAVVVASDGAIWVAGSFSGQCTFGLGEPHETRVDGGAYFLARYQPNGLLAWAGSIATGGAQACLTSLPDGGVALAGPYHGKAIFHSGNPAPSEISPGFFWNTFLARYRADGTLAWVRQIRSSWLALPQCIVALPDGGMALTGRYFVDADFGEGENGAIRLLECKGGPAFTSRYSNSGNVLWVRRSDGFRSYNWGRALVSTPQGGVTVCGYSRGLATFDSGEAGQTTLPGNDRHRLYLAFYRPDGSLGAVDGIEGSESVKGDAVATAPDGTLLVMGHFTGKSSFSTDESHAPQTVADSDVSDVFLARYDVAH